MIFKIIVTLLIAFSFDLILCKLSKPPKPPHITLRGVNSNTFDLDVGSIQMDIIAYRFEILSNENYTKDSGRWTNPRVVLQDFEYGLTYLITDLKPNTSYWIRVASKNSVGLSDWTGPGYFQTLPTKASDTNS